MRMQNLFMSIISLSVCSVALSGCLNFHSTNKDPAVQLQTVSAAQDNERAIVAYDVHFDFNSTALSEEGNTVVDNAAKAIKVAKPTRVIVSGYADRSGNAAYNAKLSQKRAGAVAKALKSRGIAPSVLKVEALGENATAIPTHDDVKILENRRVVITLLK